jgi:hypothetical protein
VQVTLSSVWNLQRKKNMITFYQDNVITVSSLHDSHDNITPLSYYPDNVIIITW